MTEDGRSAVSTLRPVAKTWNPASARLIATTPDAAARAGDQGGWHLSIFLQQAEVHFDGGLHGYGLAVLLAGAEFPLLDGFNGFLV